MQLRRILAILPVLALLSSCAKPLAPDQVPPTQAPAPVADKAPEPAVTAPPQEQVPAAPAPEPEKPAITLHQAFNRVNGTPEAISELHMYGSRYVAVHKSDKSGYYYISVGENFPERVRMSQHFRVNMSTGAVEVMDILKAEYRTTELITVTKPMALDKLKKLPEVAAWLAKHNENLVMMVAEPSEEEYRIWYGEKTATGTNWALRYAVSRINLVVWAETVWEPDPLTKTPVTQDQAAAMVEQLEPAKAIRADAGDTYATEANDGDPAYWSIVLKTETRQDDKVVSSKRVKDFDVEKATGLIRTLTFVQY